MKGIILSVLLLLLATLSFADYQIVSTFVSPDLNISGLGYGNGSLWAVDRVTENVYEVDPATGSVQNSWYCSVNGARIPSGLTFAYGTVYIASALPGSMTDPYVYKYSSSGTYSGNFDLDC
ncbi:MAG: hypothetical protein KAS73_04465 [Candidatus Sabulitectum sp.]|nr:hypothetical protein [Candidatus Sabulitectum sp.]